MSNALKLFMVAICSLNAFGADILGEWVKMEETHYSKPDGTVLIKKVKETIHIQSITAIPSQPTLSKYWEEEASWLSGPPLKGRMDYYPSLDLKNYGSGIEIQDVYVAYLDGPKGDCLRRKGSRYPEDCYWRK